MAEIPPPSPRTPWHLWVVGIVSLLWNAVGAVDFVLTEARNATYLKDFTPVQLEYLAGLPLWVVLAWAVGVWGSVLGSLFLLARRQAAVCCFVCSLVGMMVTSFHNYVLSDWRKVMGGGAGMVVFSSVIFLIGLFLWVYARAMRQRGVLR